MVFSCSQYILHRVIVRVMVMVFKSLSPSLLSLCFTLSHTHKRFPNIFPIRTSSHINRYYRTLLCSSSVITDVKQKRRCPIPDNLPLLQTLRVAVFNHPSKGKTLILLLHQQRMDIELVIHSVCKTQNLLLKVIKTDRAILSL